jgi:Mg2+-importing ATPase
MATAIIVNTGTATAFGAIAAGLNRTPPPSDFQRGISAFGALLVKVTTALVFAIFAANMYFHRPFLESFLFAVALAVGLVPELLPAIVGVTLAAGARRMAKRGVIVKRLAVIENFGSMNVLCSDKTGTLTEGKVKLDGALDVEGAASTRVLRYAAINAAFESGFSNPIDAALRAALPSPSGVSRLDEVPYDFIRRKLSVLVHEEGGATPGPMLVTKGALKDVLAVCTNAQTPDGGRVPLATLESSLFERFQALSEQGLRVLGVATRAMPGATGVRATDETAMTFEGFLAFADPPRADAAALVAELRALEIRLQIITGDNAAVATRVARAVGLASPVVVTGRELHMLSEAALVARIDRVDVFAEVEPNQKERIILAQKKAGHVVGFLGDGINDATALHTADVGISVDSAADVAKEAAEIVLLQHDLRVVLEGVREGRATFANTLKYIYITTSANFGNMLSMAGATLFLPFLPLLPRQILLNNFLSDFPAMTIATDHVDPAQVAKPQRWDVLRIRNFMFVFGAISSVFDCITFGLLFWLGGSEETFRTGWFLVSLLTELVILLVMRTHQPFLRSRPSPALLGATLAVALLATGLVMLPIGRPFGLVPLSPSLFALCLTITAGYTWVSERAKQWFFHRFSSQSPAAVGTLPVQRP